MGQKFTKKNDEFICEVCGKQNPPAPETCRNHCKYCLHSKHVDIHPGDRANTCQGVLLPMDIEFGSGEMKNIRFQCKKCAQKSRNKIAIDDDREALFKLLEH